MPIPTQRGTLRRRGWQNYDRQAELFEKKVIAQATLDTFNRISKRRNSPWWARERRSDADMHVDS